MKFELLIFVILVLFHSYILLYSICFSNKEYKID